MFCPRRLLSLLLLFAFSLSVALVLANDPKSSNAQTLSASATPTTGPTPTPLPREENPGNLACGFPLHGYHNVNEKTWTLTSDCQLPAIEDFRDQYVHFEGKRAVNNACPSRRNYTIDGAGYTVTGAAGQMLFFADDCVKVTLKNITFVLDNRIDNQTGWTETTYYSHFYVLGRARLVANNMTVRSSSGGWIFDIRAARATFTNLKLSNNTDLNTTFWTRSLVFITSDYVKGSTVTDPGAKATFTHTRFCNNRDFEQYFTMGGTSTVELKGDFRHENNLFTDATRFNHPTELHWKGSNATFTDNSTEKPCVDVAPAKVCNPHCWIVPWDEVLLNPKLENCFQPLGIIGIICKPWVQPFPGYITIWLIDEHSMGHFQLGVTQPQVEKRKSPGLIASTPNGRVAAYVVGPECIIRDEHGKNPRMTKQDPIGCLSNQLTYLRAQAMNGESGDPLGWERYIVVAKGPNFEGKVHTAIFDSAVSGRVVGTADVFIGEPGIVHERPQTSGEPMLAFPKPVRITVPFVTPQEAQEDGSLVHAVGSGDTLHSIAVAYEMSPWKIAAMNELEDEGRWLQVGQELVIREASAEAQSSAPEPVVHVVRAGESINLIAVKHRVRADEIVELNGLVNGGRRIYPGQELVIRDAS